VRPVVASGSFTALTDESGGVVRVGLRAETDVVLAGFDVCSVSVPCVEPPVVLAHPNLDQESHGPVTRRLREGQVVVRGFDQAVGRVVVAAVGVESWVTTTHTRWADGEAVIDVRQRDVGDAPVLVPAGSDRWSDPVVVGEWDDPLDGLAVAASSLPSLAPPAPVVRGWNSWDFYGWMLNPGIVSAEAAALPDGFDHMVLTGPWFDTIGDWRPRFPLDAGDGRVLGLWLAPFMAESDSAVVSDHPDWLLPDVDGSIGPVGTGVEGGRRCGVLDATRPEVRAHLAVLARRLTGECGARYLFCDFLRVASAPARRHDRTVTGVEAFRMGMRALRDGCAPGTTVMAASGIVGLYPGVAHAGRIGPDITFPPMGHPLLVRWTPPGVDPQAGFTAESHPPGVGRVLASWDGVGGVRRQAAAMASRWHLGAALVPNPDAVLLNVPLAQARTTAALWAMAGGVWLAGDSLLSLPPSRRALLTHPGLLEVQAMPGPARPVDLFSGQGLPAVWRKGGVSAYVNWDDWPMTVEVSGVDVWTGEAVGPKVVVAPHDTALVRA
jgi:hypothetical protein